MTHEFVPIIASTKWRGETERYAARMGRLTVKTQKVIAQFKRFPGMLNFVPTPAISVKYRGLIYTNQLYGSADEALRSAQLLWDEGHFLCAGHCIRLLYETVGGFRHFQKKVLLRSQRSEQEAKQADEKLQNLMLATNAPILLPAGIEEKYKIVSVANFIEQAEAYSPGFKAEYDFLCDISHPTFMHQYLYHLRYDHSWSNPLFVEEVHKTLERIVQTAEDGVAYVAEAVAEIYNDCVPDIEKAIAESSAKA